ncbi:hypothetical protein V8F33_010704 [Rhypophila sp. PSN 637]
MAPYSSSPGWSFTVDELKKGVVCCFICRDTKLVVHGLTPVFVGDNDDLPPALYKFSLYDYVRPVFGHKRPPQQGTDVDESSSNTETEPLEKEDAILLPCGHLLGKTCVDLWKNSCNRRGKKVSCPTCRIDLVPSPTLAAIRCERHRPIWPINIGQAPAQGEPSMREVLIERMRQRPQGLDPHKEAALSCAECHSTRKAVQQEISLWCALSRHRSQQTWKERIRTAIYIWQQGRRIRSEQGIGSEPIAIGHKLELEPPRCPRHNVPGAINLARPLPNSSRTRLWLRQFILRGTEPERTPNQYPTEGDKYGGEIAKDCHRCFEERRPDWKAMHEANCREWIAKGFFSPWSPEQVESDWHTDFEYDPDDEFDWGDRYIYLPRAAKAQDQGDGEQPAKRRKLSKDA